MGMMRKSLTLIFLGTVRFSTLLLEIARGYQGSTGWSAVDRIQLYVSIFSYIITSFLLDELCWTYHQWWSHSHISPIPVWKNVIEWIFSETQRKKQIAVLKTPGRNSLCRIMYLAQLLTQGLPSGNVTVCYGKSPFLIGKSTISTGPFSIGKSSINHHDSIGKSSINHL